MNSNNILEFKKPTEHSAHREELHESSFKDNILDFKSSSQKKSDLKFSYNKYVENIIFAPKIFVDQKRYVKLGKYLLNKYENIYENCVSHSLSASALHQISPYNYEKIRYSASIDFLILHHIKYEKYEIESEENVPSFAYGMITFMYNLETKKEQINYWILESTFTAYPFLKKWLKLPINLLWVPEC